MTMAGSAMRRWMVVMATAAIIAAGCSSIRIETGQTPEEAAAGAESQASEVRRTFARAFDGATGEQVKAAMLKQLIDTSAARLITVGRSFAREWEAGNEGRGQVISADDFRQIIQNSIAKDQPILQAWEDNIEYGWEYVRDSSRFDERVKGKMRDLVDQYYGVYSAVFYPKTDVVEYREELYRVEEETWSVSRELQELLERSR